MYLQAGRKVVPRSVKRKSFHHRKAVVRSLGKGSSFLSSVPRVPEMKSAGSFGKFICLRREELLSFGPSKDVCVCVCVLRSSGLKAMVLTARRRFFTTVSLAESHVARWWKRDCSHKETGVSVVRPPLVDVIHLQAYSQMLFFFFYRVSHSKAWVQSTSAKEFL